MTSALDQVEYAAWQLAAEPVEWRMEHLLKIVCAAAPFLAGRPGALRSPVVPEGIDLISVPASAPAAPEAAPEAREDAAGGNVADAASEMPAELPEAPAEAPAEDDDIYVTARDVLLFACPGGCGRGLPRTQEFFSLDNSRKDGLRGRCKKCESAARKARRMQKAGAA